MFSLSLRAVDRIEFLVNLQLSSAALLCANVIKALNPQSPQARAILNLGVVTAIVPLLFSQWL
jgi:hypothetical protein